MKSKRARCPICENKLTLPINVEVAARRQHKRNSGYCARCKRVFAAREIVWK